MWGTSSPEDKLTGDLGNVIEATLIRGRRSDFFYSRKISAGPFGTFATISAQTRSTEASRQDRVTEAKADVEIVATYELYNIYRTRLENLIHRVFDPGRLDVEIKDRFGQPVIPREWFLVPLFVIDEAVDRIKDGTITDYIYDPTAAALVRAET
jgi:Meiotically up-regulated gene 113